MSKKISSFILPDDIIKDMKDKIKSTKKLKIELGFALCTDKYSDKIVKGPDCTGEKCSIKTGICDIYQTQIGNYHTHPRAAATMSITDMVTGCSEDIQCIGSVKYNNITCFVRKTDESSCLRDTSSFEEDEHKIIQKGIEIRDALDHPTSIIRTGIYNFLKEMKKHDDTVVKYNANRIKLLRRNFDRINI